LFSNFKALLLWHLWTWIMVNLSNRIFKKIDHICFFPNVDELFESIIDTFFNPNNKSFMYKLDRQIRWFSDFIFNTFGMLVHSWTDWYVEWQNCGGESLNLCFWKYTYVLLNVLKDWGYLWGFEGCEFLNEVCEYFIDIHHNKLWLIDKIEVHNSYQTLNKILSVWVWL